MQRVCWGGVAEGEMGGLRQPVAGWPRIVKDILRDARGSHRIGHYRVCNFTFHPRQALYCAGQGVGCVEEGADHVAASATFSGNAKKLFQDPATARETARQSLSSWPYWAASSTRRTA